MNRLVVWIQIAGLVQLVIAAANFVIPRILEYRENIGRMTLMVRQVFLVHAGYIVAAVAFQGVLCLLFAGDLASGAGMGQFVSGYLALFWMARVGIQLLYYDPSVRKRYRWGDILFLGMFLFLGVVFSVATWGGAT
jgi:hypothetical protein